MDINFSKNYSSGTDENKSETEQNTNRQTKKTPRKNFMAPTISARSKSISPKKRILTECNENFINTLHQKPSNLGKKSTLNKLGVCKNPIPKISTLPSSVLNDNKDENVEIDGDFVVPYDPLTNCLSPRPKFLRYNPSRLRDRVVFDNSSDDGISPSRVSVDSLSFCGGESCLIEEKVTDDDPEEVIDDEEDEEEEEMNEERKWGLKWEVVKFFMVFCVLVVSSMYVTSMNLNVSLFDDQKYGNMTSGVISLFEIDRICVESDRIMGRDVDYENEIVISEALHLGNFIDQGLKGDNDVVVESETSLVDSNDSDLVNLEPKCQVGEILAHVFFKGIEEKDVDFKAKSSDLSFELENELEIVNDKPQFEAEFVSDNANVEIKLMDEDEIVALVEEDVDFEAKSNDWGLELVNEVNVVGYEVENVDDEPQLEPEVVGEEANGEIGLMDEDETISLVGEDGVEYEQNEITLQTSKSVVLVLILSLMTSVVSLVKFYYKCKKASSKTSNVKKVCSQQGMNKQKQAPKEVTKKLEPIHTNDSYLDSSSIARTRDERVEITAPPTRVIPKVKLLCEFDVVREARSSLHRCDMSSNKEEERMMVNKRSEFDTTSSHLQPSGSYISKEMTSPERAKEETMSKATPTPLRRSSRLRSRGVTSP